MNIFSGTDMMAGRGGGGGGGFLMRMCNSAEISVIIVHIVISCIAAREALQVYKGESVKRRQSLSSSVNSRERSSVYSVPWRQLGSTQT